MNNLSTEQMRRLQLNDGDLTLINVLAEEEFHKKHIPGSSG